MDGENRFVEQLQAQVFRTLWDNQLLRTQVRILKRENAELRRQLGKRLKKTKQFKAARHDLGVIEASIDASVEEADHEQG